MKQYHVYQTGKTLGGETIKCARRGWSDIKIWVEDRKKPYTREKLVKHFDSTKEANKYIKELQNILFYNIEN